MVLGMIFLRYADHKFTVAQKELEGKGTGRRAVCKIDYQARVLYLFLKLQQKIERIVRIYKEFIPISKVLKPVLTIQA